MVVGSQPQTFAFVDIEHSGQAYLPTVPLIRTFFINDTGLQLGGFFLSGISTLPPLVEVFSSRCIFRIFIRSCRGVLSERNFMCYFYVTASMESWQGCLLLTEVVPLLETLRTKISDDNFRKRESGFTLCGVVFFLQPRPCLVKYSKYS